MTGISKQMCLAALLILLLSANSAHAALKRIGVIAPGLASTRALQAAAGRIEKVLNGNLPRQYTVEVMDLGQARALSWAEHLRTNTSKDFPDFIFYYLPARDLAKELEEVLFTERDEFGGFVGGPNFGGNCARLPGPAAWLLKSDLCERWGKTLRMRGKMKELSEESRQSTPDKKYLYVSFSGLRWLFTEINAVSRGQTQILLLLAPEKVQFYRDVFDRGTWADSLSLFLLPTLNISRTKLKENMTNGSVDAVPFSLLPKTFYSLYRPVNLVSGSRRKLNAMGALEWADLIGKYTLDYFNRTAAYSKSNR